MFTVKLEDIPEEGLALKWEEPRDSLFVYIGRLPSIDFDFEAPLRGEAHIRKIGNAYLVQGSLHTLLHLRCGRCLKEFSYPLSSVFDVSLQPGEPRPEEEGDVELHEGDLEVHSIEGGEIRLSEIGCEQIFLEIPYQPLCTDNCKGLCPRCGRDLNLGPCGCARESWGKGFEALKKLKIDPS